jgi:hypothetical protein
VGLASTTRARWIIRLCLAGLLLAMVLAVVLAWPRSSPISSDEAMKRFSTLELGMTRSQVEAMLGSPNDVTIRPAAVSIAHWACTRETFTESDTLHITLYFDAEQKLAERYSMRFGLRGWDAWQWRWARWWGMMGGAA